VQFFPSQQLAGTPQQLNQHLAWPVLKLELDSAFA
jgi:hypothetical protein